MFNLRQFQASINVLFADKAERHVHLANLIGDSLQDAAIAWLCGGSSSLADALTVIVNSPSKTAVAKKMKTTIKSVEFSFGEWATVAGGNLVTSATLIGGNSPRVKNELAAREEACLQFGAVVREAVGKAFAPVEPDADRDPLASLGIKPEEGSIKATIIKIGKASDDQLANALDRVWLLWETLSSAADVRKQTAAEQAAAEQAAAEQAAAEDSARRDQIRAELREQMIREEIGQIANNKIAELKTA